MLGGMQEEALTRVNVRGNVPANIAHGNERHLRTNEHKIINSNFITLPARSWAKKS